MKAYQIKSKAFHGTDYEEVYPQAAAVFKRIKDKNPRRQPNVRSPHFSNSKIFIGTFWQHLNQKSNPDRIRRLKFFGCGIELIRNSRFEPTTKKNPNKPNFLMHRFAGVTADKELFYVQIQENTKTGKRYLMSAFPEQ